MNKKLKTLLAAAMCALLVLTMASCTLTLPGEGLPERGSADVQPQVVYFGHYPLGSDGTPNPLTWFVLDNSGGELLLISSDILRGMSYDASGNSWEASSLRTWLNGEFYNAVFSTAEKAALLGSDKVKLMTKAQAQNAAYFGNDTVRAAMASPYAQTIDGYTGDAYWLADSSSGMVSAVDSSGAVTDYPSTDVCGVRPVIRVNVSDIALVLGFAMTGSSDGDLVSVSSAPSPYSLALFDESLPSLSVTGYAYDDTGLTFDCAPSAALTGDQQIYCYMHNLDGGSDYSGWAALTGGKIRFKIDVIDERCRYEALLAVADPPAFMMETYYVGAVGSIDCVDALQISGIAKDDQLVADSDTPFSAALWFKTKDAEGSGDCWMPVSWAADAQSGTWSGAPYDASLSFDTPGDYTLTVTYHYGSYDGIAGTFTPAEPEVSATRSVTFHVDAALTLTASPSDGGIYTGGVVTITPNLAGGTWDFDSAYLSQDGNAFTGLKAGTTTVTYTVGAQSKSVTVTITQALALDVSPAGGGIYTGGRATITPNLAGGTWDFDSAYLSRDGSAFTGLKAGTVTVTYTVGAQSKSVTVTIRQSEVPDTGQDMTWVWTLCGGGLMIFSAAGLLASKRRSARAR